MKQKILIICGPTATGKSSLGLKLAQKFDGEIISADSRQVYRGMDIGTGKSLPVQVESEKLKVKNLEDLIVCYEVEGIKIWGYDIADPNDDFSVAEYRELMIPVIKDIQNRNTLPIIVGGTGFYIDALVDPPDTIGISENTALRQKLAGLSVEQLQKKLAELDTEKLESMNNSDKNNPRRLVRAIEVAMSLELRAKNKDLIQDSGFRIHKHLDFLWIGLSGSLQVLKERVARNVQVRATNEFTQEIKNLEAKGFDWDSKAASATGYAEWKAYLEGALSKAEVLDQWILREHQYQKRQLTWFKKKKEIKWFDIREKELLDLVADQVLAWYS